MAFLIASNITSFITSSFQFPCVECLPLLKLIFLIPSIMCSPSLKGNRWTLAMTGDNWKSICSVHQFPINILKCLFFKNNSPA